VARTVDLGVLISGSGRSLQNFIDEIDAGRLEARIRVVVSTSPFAGGNERARRAGIPLVVVDRKIFPSDRDFSAAVTKALEGHPVDIVLLAGFMHLWEFPPAFRGRVLNIHPALLPRFGGKGMYGHRVHEAVLKSGATETGCTVHLADLEYDHGPIILQRRVPVRPGDTVESLAARVFAEECIAYPEAVRRLASAQGQTRDTRGSRP
jgi:formyltetrahydrofolate-dependent phosphoribosylglycinamide formyltransferase